MAWNSERIYVNGSLGKVNDCLVKWLENLCPRQMKNMQILDSCESFTLAYFFQVKTCVSDWCQPEAQPSQWLLLRQQFPRSLRLSICDADWYGHFRSIGKRVIYDQAVALITLPIAAVVSDAKLFIRFNQRAFPTDLFQYNSESRQIEIRLVDMPSDIQTIDIGFSP